MILKDISSKEFYNLSKKEQDQYLIKLKNKYNELSYKQVLEENKLLKNDIKYNFNVYQESLQNNINSITFFNPEKITYEIFFSKEELNEMENYGLNNIFINKCKCNYNYDFIINISQGYISKNNIILNNEVIHYIDTKCNNPYIKEHIKEYKYAYIFKYTKINRKNKSIFWRLLNKRKILYQ